LANMARSSKLGAPDRGDRTDIVHRWRVDGSFRTGTVDERVVGTLPFASLSSNAGATPIVVSCLG